MKKLLLSIVFIAGCDYAPTEHTHDEHFSCVFYWGQYVNTEGGIVWESYETESSDSLAVIHASNVNHAESECKNHQLTHPSQNNMDSVWCKCEPGINF